MNQARQNSASHSDGSMMSGLLISAVLHLTLIGLVILGLPIFWEPEPAPEGISVELAQLSDITAAPKVEKAGKPEKKPEPPKPVEKPKQEVKKEEPPKPAPPTPAAPPPPTPKAEPIPDPLKKAEKKPEEKKPEEKKPDKPKEEVKKEEKKPQEKPDDQELDALLQNVLKEEPAPETPEKPKKKAEAKPVEPTAGPQTANVSEIPMTASEEDGIRAQIEQNWNLGPNAGAPNLVGMIVELRIELQPDGTVTRVTVLNASNDSFFRAVAESAVRAVKISSPLKLPAGKHWPTMRVRFYPDQVVQ